MSAPPNPSLFAIVRAHLGHDSDSESSGPPTSRRMRSRTMPVVNILPKALHTRASLSTGAEPMTTPGTNPCSSTVNFARGHFRAMTLSKTEPFPDFNEEESKAQDVMDRALEECFAAAMRIQNREVVVEPSIKTPFAQHIIKRFVLDDLKDLLSDPALRLSTRQRFIALTNMVIRLDHSLFPTDGTPPKIDDALEIAQVMMPYLSSMDDILQGLVDSIERVDLLLVKICDEEPSPLMQYRQKASVVSEQLKKPRRIEQSLLELFLDFYDAWVYEEYRRVRDEGTVDGAHCAAVFGHVDAIRETLDRANRNYSVYREALLVLKEKHFPAVLMPVRSTEFPEPEPAFRPEGNFF